jgi:uncharacterized phage protein (TIGR02220 family)
VKLVYCTDCEDVVKPLAGKQRKCGCGALSVTVTAEGVTQYKGPGNPLDMSDSFFTLQSFRDETAEKKYQKKDNGADRLFATQVLEYLNQVCGTEFSTKYPSPNCTLILERKGEHNCTLEDFKRIVDNKFKQWGTDPERCHFLRPITLFSKTKFSNYLGEKTLQNANSNRQTTFTAFADTIRAAKK